MKTVAKVLIGVSLLLACIAIVGYSYDLYVHGTDKDFIGWFASGGFVVLTFLISVRLIVMHLLNWRQPNIQKYIVRIIWMVPLYAVESWLALRFRTAAIYIETFRECYEAYVVYNFFYYIIALLGDSESQLISILKTKPKERGIHRFPFNMFIISSTDKWIWYWPPSWSYHWDYCSNSGRPIMWSPGAELLRKCKYGVLQYVVIKNMLALVVFTLETLNLYDEGHFDWKKGYGYISVVNLFSQAWALYCLVLFYNVTKEELAPFKPFGKFLCVKMVVFFTWWQSIIISLAASYKDFSMSTGDSGDIMNLESGDSGNASSYSRDTWSGEQISKGVQDFMICIEMFIFAIAFTFTFPYKDFQSTVESPGMVIATPHRAGKEKDELASDVENVEHTKTHVAIPVESTSINSTGPKQSFFFAFLHSSIPHDVWDDIKGEMWQNRNHEFELESPQIDTDTPKDSISIVDSNTITNNLVNNGISPTNTSQFPHTISIATYAKTSTNSTNNTNMNNMNLDLDSIKRSGSSILFEDEDDEESRLL